NRRAPDFFPGLRVERIKVLVDAADEDEPALDGERAPAAVRRSETIGQRYALEQRVIADRCAALAKRYFPCEIALVEIEGRQHGIGRRHQRKTADGCTAAA